MKTITNYIYEQLNVTFDEMLNKSKFSFVKEKRPISEYESMLFEEDWVEYILNEFDNNISFAYCPATNEFALYIDSQRALYNDGWEINDEEPAEAFNQSSFKSYSKTNIKKLNKLYSDGEL